MFLFFELFIQMQETVKSLDVLIHLYIALTESTDLKALLIVKLKSLRSKSVYTETVNIFWCLCEDVFYFYEYLILQFSWKNKAR